ncbi:MAG: ribonuclease R [Rhodospirillales bacterium]|nr:ribonuclease R [Rhodospirillales bacterium]
MTRPTPKASAAPLPSREQILEYIQAGSGRVGKRELARAFRLNGEQKIELRQILRELVSTGAIGRDHGRRYRHAGRLPAVAVLEILDVDVDGELTARPVAWEEEGPPPKIAVVPDRSSRAALTRGDRALARLSRAADGGYEARVIRRLHAGAVRTLGVYELVGGRGRLLPIDRRSREELEVPGGGTLGAEPGELVWAEVEQGRPLGLRRARIVERCGPAHGPRSISLITINDHDIPVRFPDAALAQAAAAGPAPLGERADLREVPLVTIDGEDARDFDDAVWAEADADPANPGGWHLLVAIADVAWYVRPDSPLDRAAFERGNSVYFPDRVVPMLPEDISNGWCSLVPGEDRPCLAAHLWLDADGRLRRHRFVRGLMRSAARLTYAQVQAAADGHADAATEALSDAVIAPLYAAYRALAAAREKRGVLELDVPERRVFIDPATGGIDRVQFRERLDSHKLIEEFMICANVAAAEALEAARRPCMYRIHDRPPDDKLEALRDFLDSLAISLPRGQVMRAGDLNRILARVAGRPEARLVNEVMLRSQSQALYAPDNVGHFGLALRRYCHFTSPIRRYADLMVHRALIDAFSLGAGGSDAAGIDLAKAGLHISATERRAAAAERDALDRFTAAYLADRVGADFAARINGVTRFGLFVTLNETGADGLIPISTLPDDYYEHDEKSHRLVGRRSRLEFRLGDALEVRLVEANPLTGGIIFALVGTPAERRPRSGSPAGKRNAGARDRQAKAKRRRR